jgi:hypothetical protein
MRLTLRTLLASLDDTLDPEEARMIGQKIAESAAAQELIERIKKVTRRRSLANPPVFGDDTNLDPNTVAEYLDDVLPPEGVAQVEQTCLDQDVYLAEVASCHQILTLMLSEPARVPPPARQRMYRLVQGPESIPDRKPPAFAPEGAAVAPGDAEDNLAAAHWPRYAVIGLVLLLGLALAIFLAWPQPHHPSHVQTPVPIGDAVVTLPVVVPNEKEKSEPKPDQRTSSDTAKAPPVRTADTDPSKSAATQEKPPDIPPPSPLEVSKKALDKLPVDLPSKEQKEIGKLTSKGVVLLRGVEKPRPHFARVLADGRVSTGQLLLSLPGFRSDLGLDNELTVSLWGSLLELLDAAVLESALTLHAPPAGFDLDMTLDRGRAVIANPRSAPARIRIRFDREVWNVNLAPQSELLCDLLRSYPNTIPFSKRPGGESPLAEIFLGVTKGKAELHILDRESVALAAPPGASLVLWNNKSGLQEPQRLAKLRGDWRGDLPARPQAKEAANEVRAALAGLIRRMDVPSADAELILTEMLTEAKPAEQLVGIFGLAAIDSVAVLCDALDEHLKPVLRGLAVVALRNWCARNVENDLALHGILQNRKAYSEPQADAALELMHLYAKEDLSKPATYRKLFGFMNDERLSIRTLAYWHMQLLDPDGIRSANYNPDMDDEPRQAAIARWRKRIPDGKLPPKAPSQP